MLRMRVILLIVINAILNTGCFYKYQAKDAELPQNWDQSDRREFYQTSQGSQLLKYDWFLALEQPSSTRLFVEDKLQRFGYLPDPFAPSNNYNPDNLPIGFVKDDGFGYIGDAKVKGPWIGMTCAACHTAEIEFNGKSHLIDGAPTDADFYSLIRELRDSITATVNDQDKFSRFASKVKDNGSLKEELTQQATKFETYVQQSTPEHKWGKARLDAVGLILNTVAHRLVPKVDSSNLDADPRKGKISHTKIRKPVRPRSDNTHLPNAPVSYPFLWDTFQQSHNQWNGVSVATLSRNTTEVLGVFATFNPDSPSKNSVQFGGLKKLQKLVTNLRSPRWTNPEYDLPPIKKVEQERGEQLYKTHCQNCHKVHDREANQVDDVEIVLNGFERQKTGEEGFERPMPDDRPQVSIGTDPAMARNFVDNTFANEKGEQLVHATDLVGGALVQVWLKSIFGALIPGAIEDNLTSRRITKDVEVYKARPLNGIWATAPYLHNGSVPNMMELLKPPAERVQEFCVGSRIFDAENMGFLSDSSDGCGDNFTFDTTQDGNLNIGHDSYGPLSHQDRLDIIEFIKSE